MGPFFQNEKNKERGAVQIILVVALLVGLLVAFLLGKSIAEEDIFRLILIGGGLGGLGLLLILGKNYWYLLLLTYPLGNTPIQLGSKSILLQELVTPLIFTWFLVNVALRKQRFTLIRKESVFILLFCVWAGVVMYLNPVGLSLFGAENGGLRFYVDIGMALCSYLIISNQKISNKDCFWVIFFIILASFLSLFQQIFFYWMYGAVLGTEGGEYTWHQALAGPALAITIYIVSKYRWSQILSFSKWYLPGILLVCLAVTFLSGKRAGAVCIIAVPLISACIRKEYTHAFVMLVASSVLVAFLVIGQGNLFTLPFQVQRALSNLPGDWDSGILNITADNSDNFRTRLWDIALEKIKKDPIIGTGFNVSDVNLQADASSIGIDQIQIEQLATGSSWHSTWLGISADFGIPAAIIYGLFMIQAALAAYVLRRKKALEKYQTIAATMLFLYFIINLITSYSGGHSAYNPLTSWWMYGVIVGLKYTLPKTAASKKDRIAQEAEISLLPVTSTT
ncbi:MAG: O-antigen ligase family protein [Chthoniobacterales bacterium]